MCSCSYSFKAPSSGDSGFRLLSLDFKVQVPGCISVYRGKFAKAWVGFLDLVDFVETEF